MLCLLGDGHLAGISISHGHMWAPFVDGSHSPLNPPPSHADSAFQSAGHSALNGLKFRNLCFPNTTILHI